MGKLDDTRKLVSTTAIANSELREKLYNLIDENGKLKIRLAKKHGEIEKLRAELKRAKARKCGPNCGQYGYCPAAK